MAGSTGTLWLIPNTLDLGVDGGASLDIALPREAVARAASLTHWVVENAKSARAFLKRVNEVQALAQPLQSLDMRELPRTPKDGRAAPLGTPCSHPRWPATTSGC